MARRTPGAGTVTGHGSAQQGDALQRARRRPGARARVRQPWLPPQRRRGDHAPLRGEALDLVPARVQGLEADTAVAAGEVHGAVLPRRGDRVRRRPPSLRALPLRGLPELCDTLAQASSGRRDRGGRDRRAAACRAGGWGTRGQRRHEAPFETLPDGAFVVDGDAAFLVLGERLLRWTPAGYVDARPRPRGTAVVLTPPSLVAVLAAGWEGAVPLLHPSARSPATG